MKDLLIANFFALNSRPDRPHDMDDIQSILAKSRKLDPEYFFQQLVLHNLEIPKSVELCFDYETLRISQKSKMSRQMLEAK